MTQDLAKLPPGERDAAIMNVCDQAILALDEARDIEAVVAIKNIADAFATYARKLKAAMAAQNQCSLVVLLAEARIGRELQAAQERGELQRPGGDRKSINVRDADNDPTLDDIGITRQRAAEYKALGRKTDEVIRQATAVATATEKRITRSDLLDRAKKAAPAAPKAHQEFAADLAMTVVSVQREQDARVRQTAEWLAEERARPLPSDADHMRFWMQTAVSSATSLGDELGGLDVDQVHDAPSDLAKDLIAALERIAFLTTKLRAALERAANGY